MIIARLLLMGLLAIVSLRSAAATDPPVIALGKGAQDLLTEVRYLADPEGLLLAESLLSDPDVREQFKPLEDVYLGFHDGPVWLYLRVRNDQPRDFSGAVEVRFPYLDTIEFIILPEGDAPRRVLRGDAHPLPDDLPSASFPAASLSLEEGQEAEILVRIESQSVIMAPLRLYDQDSYILASTQYQVIYALMFGAALAIALYVLTVYLTVRDRSYPRYIAFSLAYAMLVAIGSGLAQVWFWPDSPGLSDALYFPVQGLVFALGVNFFRSYLGTATQLPRIDRLFQVMICTGLISMFPAFLPEWLTRLAIGFNAGPGPLLVWGVASWLAWKGLPRARVVVIGWGLSQLGAAYLYLRVFNLVPYAEINHYLMMMGCLIGSLYFATALALGLRMQQERLLLAEKLNDTKSSFLAGMSHELRTPLNAIIGFTEMMRSEVFGPVKPDAYAGYVEDIHASGKHLLRLVNDILDISKIEAGKFELEKEVFDLTLVVQDAVDMLRVEARRAQVSLNSNPPQLATRINADRRALLQILINLINNAIKFTEPGGWVTVTWRAEGSHVLIEVTDTGIGIPADQLDTILKPFEQVRHEAHKSKAGSGLGLPLSNALAALHGGQLMLRSEPGIGTSITVRLPAGIGGGIGSALLGGREKPADAEPLDEAAE